MVAKRKLLWFGFLEAGDKGSPVVLDRGLDVPGRPTVYLFNLKKGRFVEYRRDIVESKLRELTAEEAGLIDQLTTAFDLARPGFVPRIPPPFETKGRPRRKRPEVEEPDFDLNAVMPLLDVPEDYSEAETDG